MDNGVDSCWNHADIFYLGIYTILPDYSQYPNNKPTQHLTHGPHLQSNSSCIKDNNNNVFKYKYDDFVTRT